jgi:hypothetical protein
MTELEEVLEYYSNLLIIQYNKKEKAKAHVTVFINALMASLIYTQIQNAYDLDTAVGVQLDVLGKYIGASRIFNSFSFPGQVFSLATREELIANTFASNKSGFSTRQQLIDKEAYGESFTYDKKQDIESLSDDDYRLLLRLKVVSNNTIASRGEIDSNLWRLFGDGVKIVSPDEGLVLFYQVQTEFGDLFLAGFEQNIIPKPAGIKLSFSIV